MPITILLQGIRKPLVFNMVKNSPRFQIFSDKIVHITVSAEDILTTIGQGWAGWSSTDWTLERFMRTEMIKQFQNLPHFHPNYELQQHILKSLGSDIFRQNRLIIPKFKALKKYCRNSSKLLHTAPLAIQNDGDEIITGEALHHLKHCELNSYNFPLYSPCVSYKHNVNYVFDETPMNLTLTPEDPDELLLHQIAAGPQVDLLYKFIVFNDTFRHAQNRPDFHMGLGAAVHLSSIQEPLELWLKALSTQHGMENNDINLYFPDNLIDAIQKKNEQDSKTILRNIFQIDRLCNMSTSAVAVSSLDITSRHLLFNSLPSVLRKYPYRYPFIIPPCFLM